MRADLEKLAPIVAEPAPPVLVEVKPEPVLQAVQNVEDETCKDLRYSTCARMCPARNKG